MYNEKLYINELYFNIIHLGKEKKKIYVRGKKYSLIGKNGHIIIHLNQSNSKIFKYTTIKYEGRTLKPEIIDWIETDISLLLDYLRHWCLQKVKNILCNNCFHYIHILNHYNKFTSYFPKEIWDNIYKFLDFDLKKKIIAYSQQRLIYTQLEYDTFIDKFIFIGSLKLTKSNNNYLNISIIYIKPKIKYIIRPYKQHHIIDKKYKDNLNDMESLDNLLNYINNWLKSNY